MFEPLIQVHSPALNLHRSLRQQPPAKPPKSHMFPAASDQPTALSRAPGTFPGAAVPSVPYVPDASTWSDPLTHVHWPPLYSHKSLRSFAPPIESSPSPPKSQKLPDLSVQLTAFCLAPGMLPGAAVPCVPYIP